MMKKILLAFLILTTVNVQAQLNNSWIDYSKTYYKFSLAKDELCRIPQAVLASVGLGATNADHFQLWRNGEQVRLFTSVTNTPLGAADYIEFFGKKNDGKPDNQLYRMPDFQLNDEYSLETDTASFFLTVNPAGGNLRFQSAANTAPSAVTPDAFFMRSVDVYFKSNLNRGYANRVGEYVYSSSYDEGEGFTSNDIVPANTLQHRFLGLNVYPLGPANSLSVSVNASGNAENTRNLRINLNGAAGVQIYNAGMPFFTYRKAIVANLPLTNFSGTSELTVAVSNTSSVSTDRMVVASIGLTYPATFNFNNQKQFYFELGPSVNGNYLNISNFNTASVPPVLYDYTTGRRYLGEIASTSGRVKFVLPASAEPVRKFMLISSEASNTNVLSGLAIRNFVNFSDPANQGDYLIITNKVLFNDGNNHNYVEDYRAYRSSSAGGSFTTKTYTIDELTDQFAFGIKGHPFSIKDFIRFADRNFTTQPKYALIIGRAVDYIDHHRYAANTSVMGKLNLVPTFGWPASDILLSSEPGTIVPLVPIGRLGVINGAEINNYLQKVIQYEAAQKSLSPNIADKAWMKKMMHVAGGKDVSENEAFRGYMNGYKRIAEDTLFGASVETFSKTATGAVQQANTQRIEELFEGGLGLIGYFGHSSANTFEFNLSSPEIYNNTGKYPFFNVSGCAAGNFFNFDPQRVDGKMSLSEKYVLANQKGSIGFLADSHFGIPPFLNFYNTNFYTLFGKTMYGNTVGNQIKQIIQNLGGMNSSLDYYTRIHLEEISLHGDPFIKMNYFTKPDYVIEEPLVKISPSIISVADVSFKVQVNMMNIGLATGDSIWVSVKRKLPNDSIKTLYDRLIPAIRFEDSLELTVPINPTTDKGLNQMIVSLDYKNQVVELFETNNTVTKDFYVFEDELRPAYPTNYAIVNQQNITFVASSANALGTQRQYLMELDTTQLFNSSFKKVFNAAGTGGTVQFTPGNVTFSDSTVYYWRVAIVPLNNADIIWNGFSFVYLPTSTSGVNQSHYYQHLQSTYDENISLSADRKLKFNAENTFLNVSTGSFPPNNFDVVQISLGVYAISNWCNNFNTLQFVVLDGITGAPKLNAVVSPTQGSYGSNFPTPRPNQFEFPFATSTQRKRIMDFIDSMPSSATIVMYSLLRNGTVNRYINTWKADDALFGVGNTLYHKLFNLGFTKLDSFTHNIPLLFKFNKDNSYPTYQAVGSGPADSVELLTASIPITLTRRQGMISSPVFGPAKSWKDFHWRGYSLETNTKDSVQFNVIGITQAGAETTLYSIDSTTKDLDISGISASQYPFVKLQMENFDPEKGSPYQLRYWRLNYLPVPEGAISPNILFTMRDTVQQGEMLNFAVAFKNISPTPFDSLLKVRITIKDRQNVDHIVNLPPRKALAANDTLIVSYSFNTNIYPGRNTLSVDVNPDNDQNEQYHYNNVLFKDFFVIEDKYNPLLDVTFDGVHILNKDIVASKPSILIKLKDESRFLELKDTALLKVQVRFPDQTLHDYHFGDTMIFIPANLSAGENTASIDFKPFFAEDGEYELIVSGKDVNGNKAGALDYHVSFSVINKPMISNLLNYPNPFTSSTAFVFTVTGSEIPQNIRIQILTITGKVVREITKDELGPIHIGRNITDFKWDGTDMYGQKLANGVYIYRVLTNLNGKSLDKYRAEGDNTDKFFNKGYGKMYLMR